MAKFTLTIDCDGAAFYSAAGLPSRLPEVARILREMARNMYAIGTTEAAMRATVRDVNGNRVGEWRISEGEA